MQFYRAVLGVAVQHAPGADYATVEAPGVLHFGRWSRRAAAEATFGDLGQANRVPLGSSVGFEVEGVEGAHRTIAARDWPLAQPPRQEPWGQTTSRFCSPSGALCEVSESPWARHIAQPLRAAGTGGNAGAADPTAGTAAPG